MLIHPILEQMHSLRLAGMVKAFEDIRITEFEITANARHVVFLANIEDPDRVELFATPLGGGAFMLWSRPASIR